jgi:23S rRNA (guanosine2251-2'-O)-methyltransferase
MRDRHSDHPRPIRREHRRRPSAERSGAAAAPWRSAKPDRHAAVAIYGWHSVLAALENPQRRFHRLLATDNAARRLGENNLRLPIEPEPVRPEVIAALTGPEAVHQGVYAEADPLPSPELDEIARGIVLVLDQITDPHNVGAILRSAAAFAVTAVVTTERHSPLASGVLAKAASGALEHVPIATVVNLARALDELKSLDMMLVGLDSAGETDLEAAPLAAPLALVVGAEGRGLRQLTRRHCDIVARLKLPGRIKSLNVSNATALALYVATRRTAEGPRGNAGT